MERVAIIGAGRRINENFFPALSCLDDLVEVAGVCSRTFESARRTAIRWNVPAVDGMDRLLELDFSVVIISITSTEVVKVLKILDRYPRPLKIILDTPAISSLSDILFMKRISRRHEMFVAEDFMNFPLFDLLRSAVETGTIGTLQEINLFNNGYRYHGTALMRSFLAFAPVRSFRRMASRNDSDMHLSFRFNNGVRGQLHYPYQPDRGRIELVGSERTIVAGTLPKAPEPRTICVEAITDDTGLLGYKLHTGGNELNVRPQAISKLRRLPFDDKSDFNLHKTCGLIRVIEEATGRRGSINAQYGIIEGVYDAALAKATSLPFFHDPMSIFGSSTLNLLWGTARR